MKNFADSVNTVGIDLESSLKASISVAHPCRSVVLLILQSAKWKQSLQFCGNTSSRCKDIDTPLRKLIKKMPSKRLIIVHGFRPETQF